MVKLTVQGNNDKQLSNPKFILITSIKIQVNFPEIIQLIITPLIIEIKTINILLP